MVLVLWAVSNLVLILIGYAVNFGLVTPIGNPAPIVIAMES